MADPAEVVEPDAASIEVVPSQALAPRQRTKEELAAIKLQALEDGIFEESMGIVQSTLAFAEITPDETEPPEKWVEEFGYENAVRRMRIAKGAWMSSKDAPFALQAAKSIATSIIKARSTEKAAPKTLNVIAISVTTSRNYDEREVE